MQSERHILNAASLQPAHMSTLRYYHRKMNLSTALLVSHRHQPNHSLLNTLVPACNSLRCRHRAIANSGMKTLLYFILTLNLFLCPTLLYSLEDDGDTSCRNKQFDYRQVNYSNQSIALSPPRLRKLAEADETIYKIVKQHYKHEEGDDCYSRALGRYLEHFDMTSGRLILHFHEDGMAPHRPLNVAWNPLAFYHLMNRFHTVLKQLFVMSLNDNDELRHGKPVELITTRVSLARKILSVMGDLGWPTDDDLHSAISSILRIQHIYDLSTKDLSHGKILEREYGISVSSDDCIAIGKQALTAGYFYLAVEWFEEARSVIKRSDPNEEQGRQRKIAEMNIQIARNMHDAKFDKSIPTNCSFFHRKLSLEPENRERRRTYFYRNAAAAVQMKFYDVIYWGLCSGEKFTSLEEESRLFCYYETRVNSAFYINPLKVEILSMNRLLVVQYHDLLSELRMERLKSDASGRLKESVTYGLDNLKIKSSTRSSTNTRIDDGRPEYSYIPRVAGLITGLRVGLDDYDGLQVVSYSAGNHIAPHMDGRSWTDVEEGGHTGSALAMYRIATFLVYLSDVIEGGATVFPLAGLAVRPTKGSAILWYNWRRSGELDPKTLHGSCPVIIGEKWVANKWILGSQQVVNPQYRCGKYVNEYFGITVNQRPIDDF